MEEQAIENRIKIAHIKNALDMGWITYNEAKEMAKPVIKSINDKSKELAKKYNMKPQLVNFSSIIR